VYRLGHTILDDEILTKMAFFFFLAAIKRAAERGKRTMLVIAGLMSVFDF
jgi:wobble nucleotide-excising tRNase